MLSKYSVRRPMTVFVGVILILILGVVSFQNMTTDLLPRIDLPYVVVMTTYPGASPEKVEQTVTKPIESVLATTNGLESINSVSSENSSMVILQLNQKVNMDSAMLEINNNIGLIESMFEEGVGTPMLIKMNPDMLPVMAASADMDGKDIKEVSKLVSDEIIPELERLDGVASVSSMGVVEERLEIKLDAAKIDDLNDRVLRSVDKTLADTKAKLDSGEKELASAKAQLDKTSQEKTEELVQKQAELSSQKEQLKEGLEAITKPLAEAEQALEDLSAQKAQLEELLAAQQAAGVPPTAEQQAALQQLVAGVEQAQAGIHTLKEKQTQLNTGLAQIEAGERQLEAGKMTLNQEMAKAALQLSQTEKELSEGRTAFEEQSKTAYEKAGLSSQITTGMIGQILTADNFSMPAGYLTESDGTYLLKVGEKFSSLDEISGLELFHISAGDIGTIKLSDVASVQFADNQEDMYAKINGNNGIILTFQKQSTASTAEVSKDLREQFTALEEKYPGLHLTSLQDQGVYIDIVTGTVIDNLLMGGALAIIILLLFLWSGKPTLIIALSIPLSLLFAVVLMYFSGVTLNIISLAGLALGVGMLVDNSIVVIENIHRMRNMGVPAAEAAVKGAKQVAGAIASSTLTTICVFLPIVFTDGISRQLFTDMGLTIGYSLAASLLVALTLVPAMSATMLRSQKQQNHRLFDRMVSGYGRSLQFVLRHKVPALVLVVALLGVSIFGATRMGTAFMPESDSDQISVTLTAPDGSTDEEIRSLSDQALAVIEGIDGVQTVGAMQSSGTLGSSGSVSMYVLLEEKRGQTSQQISAAIEDKTSGLDAEIKASSSGMNMSMLGGQGMSIAIQGQNLDQLKTIAGQIEELLRQTEGTKNVSNALKETSPETRVTVDKNKALSYGLTVAQVYQELAAAVKTETESTTVTIDAADYPVILIESGKNPLNRGNLSSYTLTGTKDGKEVEIKLGDIAVISDDNSLDSISHENQVRTLTVSAEIDGEHNIGLVSREFEKKLDSLTLPDGYTVKLEGENETINETFSDLFLMIALAIAFIYLIMVAQFQSLISPFIVLFTIPLAFTGGLLALMLTGMPLSMISLLGFLVLAGIVVNNGIVFVDYANQLRLDGAQKRDALIETGKTRLRPILMTALTTILGLSTMALGIGKGADMIQPMAVVTIGGLAYATFMTLYIVPILYDLFRRKPMRNRDKEVDDL